MAQNYSAPTWTDGSGQGISASQLQALSNAVEALCKGSDKAIHSVTINGSTITITYADGSIGTETIVGLKWIISINKTATVGLVDTYTITFSDGSTSTFTVTNGEQYADMKKSDYDPNEDVLNAGGIKAYVDTVLGDIETLLAAL